MTRAFQSNAFQNNAFQMGTPSPTPVPTSQGGGHGYGSKRRRYIKLRDGRQFEVETDNEVRDIVQRIIDDRAQMAEKPVKKTKISRKIRQRPSLITVNETLQAFSDWSGLYAALDRLQIAVITEQVLLDLIRKTVLAELEDEQDVEILLLLT